MIYAYLLEFAIMGFQVLGLQLDLLDYLACWEEVSRMDVDLITINSTVFILGTGASGLSAISSLIGNGGKGGKGGKGLSQLFASFSGGKGRSLSRHGHGGKSGEKKGKGGKSGESVESGDTLVSSLLDSLSAPGDILGKIITAVINLLTGATTSTTPIRSALEPKLSVSPLPNPMADPLGFIQHPLISAVIQAILSGDITAALAAKGDLAGYLITQFISTAVQG